jgi:hypothetical protein
MSQYPPPSRRSTIKPSGASQELMRSKREWRLQHALAEVALDLLDELLLLFDMEARTLQWRSPAAARMLPGLQPGDAIDAVVRRLPALGPVLSTDPPRELKGLMLQGTLVDVRVGERTGAKLALRLQRARGRPRPMPAPRAVPLAAAPSAGVDLRGLLLGVLQNHAIELRHARVWPDTHIALRIMPVPGAPHRLEQLFALLLRGVLTAVHALPEEQPRRLELHAGPVGDQFAVRLLHNGRPHGGLLRALDSPGPSSRLDDEARLVLAIVQEHGARLWTSDDGNECCVHLLLPQA